MNRRSFTSLAGMAATGFCVKPELLAQSCGTLPSPASAVPFTLPANPAVVQRPSVIELAGKPTELARFRLAMQRMKDLPRSNPAKFALQVNLHCNHCGRGAAPEIHFNWAFLPWHRAMLYFHERILNKLVPARPGQAPIRIPYWPWDDWANPANRTTPAIYGARNQSLWAQRNPPADLTQEEVNVEPILGLRNNIDFLGGPSKSPATFSGPHADVHNWANAILSDLKFSPLDPLFYAHHANIDRLWSSWLALGNGRTNPDFGDTKGYFFDEEGKWRSIAFNSLRQTEAAGYKYSSLMQPTLLSSPQLLSLRMNASRIDSVNDAASAIKGNQTNFVLLRGLKLGTLAKESRFGVFAGGPGTAPDVNSANFIGRFSTVKPIEADVPGGLTIVLSARNLRGVLTEKPLLRIFALDNQGKSKGNGILLNASDVSLL